MTATLLELVSAQCEVGIPLLFHCRKTNVSVPRPIVFLPPSKVQFPYTRVTLGRSGLHPLSLCLVLANPHIYLLILLINKALLFRAVLDLQRSGAGGMYKDFP
jgi:hypothetical protein